MKTVRPGGSVTLPDVPNAEAIYEAILQFDWQDPSKWIEGRPNVREVKLLVEGNVNEQAVKAVWKVLVKKVEEIVSRQQASRHVRVKGGAK